MIRAHTEGERERERGRATRGNEASAPGSVIRRPDHL